MSFHWSRDCLFSRLFRLTATKRQRLLITARGPSNANELPLHRANDIESVSMLWRQLEGWQPSFIISLVVVRWLIYVTKLGGLSFRQWLGSCLVMRPANYTLINSVGDYYNTLGRRQFYCLFNSLFGLTTKKKSRQSVPAPLWWELMYYREFPLQRASNAQMLPWHGMTLSWEIATYKNTSFILFIDDRFTVSMKTMSRRFDSFCRHWRHRGLS